MRRRLVLVIFLVVSVGVIATFAGFQYWNPLLIEISLRTFAKNYPEAQITWERASGPHLTPTLGSIRFVRDGQEWRFDDVSWAEAADGGLENLRAEHLTVRTGNEVQEFAHLKAARARASIELELPDWQATWRPKVFGETIATDLPITGHWKGLSLSHRSDRDVFTFESFDGHWAVSSQGAIVKVEWKNFPVGDYLPGALPLRLKSAADEIVRRDDSLPLKIPELATLWREGDWVLGERSLGSFTDGLRPTDGGLFHVSIEAKGLRAQWHRYDGASPDVLASRLIWQREPKKLSADEAAKLVGYRAALMIESPAPLPGIADGLSSDVKVVAKSAPWVADLMASAHAGAPTEVMYFASVAKVADGHCEEARPWLADLIAHPAPTSLLGKSFALLAECESDAVKRRQLLESALAYVPKDARVRELEKKTPAPPRAPAATGRATKKSTVSKKPNPKSKRSGGTSGR